MKIFVKTHRKKVMLEVQQHNFCVDDIKRKVNKELNKNVNNSCHQCYTPLCDLTLVVQKRNRYEYLKLEEGRTLADYNIRNRATLYLLDRFNWPEYYNGSWGTSDNCIKTIQAIESSCS